MHIHRQRLQSCLYSNVYANNSALYLHQTIHQLLSNYKISLTKLNKYSCFVWIFSVITVNICIIVVHLLNYGNFNSFLS